MKPSAQETIYYLEMYALSEHRARTSSDDSFCVSAVVPPDPNINKRFYLDVGKDYLWHERRNWSLESWSEYASQKNLFTYVARAQNNEIGYFELLRVGSDVELSYFGLLPGAVGLGYGSAMLSLAVQKAWCLLDGIEGGRLWVHTCNFDHPNALGNYQSSGFTVYKTETLGG